MSRKSRALVDETTRYEDDVTCQVFVAMYPKGATLDMIGGVLSLSRERVRQIEAVALGKLLARCRAEGVDFPSEADGLGAAVHGAGRKYL